VYNRHYKQLDRACEHRVVRLNAFSGDGVERPEDHKNEEDMDGLCETDITTFDITARHVGGQIFIYLSRIHFAHLLPIFCDNDKYRSVDKTSKKIGNLLCL